nr:PREDICTED: uncharacterized protein LOC103376232 [Stegastes partitus]
MNPADSDQLTVAIHSQNTSLSQQEEKMSALHSGVKGLAKCQEDFKVAITSQVNLLAAQPNCVISRSQSGPCCSHYTRFTEFVTLSSPAPPRLVPSEEVEEPMQVGQAKLSTEERLCLQEDRCFYCGQQGHLLAALPAKEQAHHRQFVVEVDASNNGLGAVLSQRSEKDKKLHPCAFLSQKLSPAEPNYDVGNRELLMVKIALEEWRHWPESQNTKPDALSRLFDPEPMAKEPEPILPLNHVAVWETDVSSEGPFFCPECQIFLPSDLTLEINTSLQTKVKDFTINKPSSAETQTAAPAKSLSAVHCDHCIETPSVAIRTCLTCDASLCQAHALLHQQRSALREHTVVEVTRDPLSLKCREHRDELKLFCMQEQVPRMLETTMNELLKRRTEAEHAMKDLETLYTQAVKSAADFRERISDKYSRIRVVLDGDERLMMQIIDAEETYMTEWLEAQRGIMEAHIKEIDRFKASRKLLLQETNDLRFLQYSVVAQESYTKGQHYWEVIVQDKPFWMIGVTTGSVDKKDSPSQNTSSLGVNNTSWCIYHGDGQYLACHDTQEKQLSVAKQVRKLGILANLQKGELSFYDADAMTLLHSFCVQCAEPLYPMFNPCIDMKGVNWQPLTLFWIKDPWDWHGDTDGDKCEETFK